MTTTRSSSGEVHCLLCGRCLAEIESDPDGVLHLRRFAGADRAQAMVRVVHGKLHCGRCGGRAFVEWDLVPTGSVGRVGAAA